MQALERSRERSGRRERELSGELGTGWWCGGIVPSRGVLAVAGGSGPHLGEGHGEPDDAGGWWSSIRRRGVDCVVASEKVVRGWVAAALVGGGALGWAPAALAQGAVSPPARVFNGLRDTDTERVEAWAPRASSTHDAPEDGCPRDALRQMMSAAAEHDAVGDVASIELEVLRLCTRRQDLIVKIAEGEARLAELRGVASVETAPAPVAGMRAPVQALPPPAKAAAPADTRDETPPALPPPRSAPARAVVGTPARPELRWTTVYGSAGDWKASVTDGAKVWYVRAGDTLPSGVEVVSVRVRPPGVAVGDNGTAWQLPGPDG